jgi:hypothetical protein
LKDSVPPLTVDRLNAHCGLIYREMKDYAAELLASDGVTVRSNQNPLKLFVNDPKNRALFGSPSEYSGWVESMGGFIKTMELGQFPKGFDEFSECYASLFFKTLDRGRGVAPQVQNFEEGLDKNVLFALRNGRSVASIFLNFVMEMENRLNTLASSISSSTQGQKPAIDKTKAQHATSREIVFGSETVKERLLGAGVEPGKTQEIGKLVGTLMATLRSSWVHNLHLQHSPAQVGELMMAADLVRRIVDVAEGINPPPFTAGIDFKARDVALLSTLHPAIFKQIIAQIFAEGEDRGALNDKTSAALGLLLVNYHPIVANDPLALPSDVRERTDRSVRLANELCAVWDSPLLPPANSSTGVTARAALVSVLLHSTQRNPDVEPLPVWEVFCGESRPVPEPQSQSKAG